MNAFIENHKYLAATILFAALACGGVSSAQAEDVAKGVLIVRGDAHGFTPNQGDNYKNEERDINDRLEGVSALCASSGSQTAAALGIQRNTLYSKISKYEIQLEIGHRPREIWVDDRFRKGQERG